jgi:mannose-1-phosphate guanylyltransferase
MKTTEEILEIINSRIKFLENSQSEIAEDFISKNRIFSNHGEFLFSDGIRIEELKRIKKLLSE